MIWSLNNILLSHRFGNPHSCTIRAQLTFFTITESHPKGDNSAKSKAGPVGRTRKKTSKVIDTPDSTELSDLLSASEREEKADGSVEDSDVGMAQDSDDNFDGAQLTKWVLHEEVKIFLFNYFFLLISSF